MNKVLLRVWEASTLPTNWFETRRPLWGEDTKELETYVHSLISEVRERGDAAISKLTKKFDHVDLNPVDFRVTREEIEDAYDSINTNQISALEFMKNKVETVEKTLLHHLRFTIEGDMKIQSVTHPIQTVGCYVPGGEAFYPSTVIMTIVPAKVAGVPRVVVCTPPKKGGKVNPLTLVAGDLCNVDEIYKIGGVQAIAALAYGTETIEPVKKIVGPGNNYVTMAKLLASRDVAIDVPAGASEVLILADETADPRIVALDMISQAEHRNDSIAGLVTTSRPLAESVQKEITQLIPELFRRDTITEALSNHGFIIICERMVEAINFTNRFAPEHLEIITEEALELSEKITSAGLILIGPYSPVSASDYCIGTNHVLPTSGFSHVLSGLSVIDFTKRVYRVEGSKKGLSSLLNEIKVLAEAEDLPNHFQAVKGRFDQ